MKGNRKRLLKSVLDYLKSDNYMLSPLISSDFRVSRMKKPMKRRNNRLLEAVLHFLKSDTYLFVPLISPPPSGFTEPNTPASSSPLFEKSSHHVKKIAMEVSTNFKNNRSTHQSANEVTGNMFSEEKVSETSILGQQSIRHRKSLKHTIHHSCRSTSVSGKRVLRSQLRKLAVD
ncbi:hypothetical protein HS088_TW04G01435 [Tripterygium wilfordii]|uniref:Uncharacterized protein n=1 Tax=Tripterygium wilfordii TaxID=458696 RepID=A0A7J7DTK6_TRIWF|nr:hypothetical protein HS088_TW04G01435 [Tripterygium wilfordii]